MILTNPPFGGEEEKGIHGKFPRRQTDRRNCAALPATHHAEAATVQGGKAGPLRMVVPNGTLLAMACAPASRKNCSRNLICTLSSACPTACSAPYTGIPTNLLFFDRSGPTQAKSGITSSRLPEGRKNYTKTAPIQFEEFAPLRRMVEQT